MLKISTTKMSTTTLSTSSASGYFPIMPSIADDCDGYYKVASGASHLRDLTDAGIKFLSAMVMKLAESLHQVIN